MTSDEITVVHTFNADISKQGSVEAIPADQARSLIRTGRARVATDADIAAAQQEQDTAERPAEEQPVEQPAAPAEQAQQPVLSSGTDDTTGVPATQPTAEPAEPGDPQPDTTDTASTDTGDSGRTKPRPRRSAAAGDS